MRRPVLLALLLLAATPASAGCLGFVPSRAPLVLVEDDLRIVGEGRPQADLGPHCENVELDEAAPAVKLLRHEGPRPESLLVRRHTGWTHDQVSTFSGRNALKAVPGAMEDATFTLDSPFREGPKGLLSLRLEDGDVLVGDKRLKPGEEATFTFSYELEPPERVRVEETLRVRNLGAARLTTTAPFGACM